MPFDLQGAFGEPSLNGSKKGLNDPREEKYHLIKFYTHAQRKEKVQKFYKERDEKRWKRGYTYDSIFNVQIGDN